MEYIEGRSLKNLVEAGPLDVEAALRLAMQIAEGLREAHRRQIVHRDIKSTNIMVTDEGRVKIMDFGLAMSPGKTQLTREGTTVGTVAYMSPEQARGEAVDHRTDLWSLGVVLYEMTSGQQPFKGSHEQAVIYSIVNEEPKQVTALRRDLPSELQRIIDRALAKSPDERYGSAEEFAKDLDRAIGSVGDAGGFSLSTSRRTETKASRRPRVLLAGTLVILLLAAVVYVVKFRRPQDARMDPAGTSTAGTTPATEFDRSIVVLPFEDISPSGDNEYFSDGLTEEIIADLSKIRSLRVISRTSAMALKGTNMDVKAIGRKLDVRYVLEGSVRKAGDKLKITAQLIDATVDAHVWAEKYDGTLEDVFDMQEKVSRAMVGALRVELSADEDRMMAERPLDDVRAYELYLRALDKSRQMSEAAIDGAIEDLERGLEIVGENALIYAAMGYAYWQYANIGARTFGEIESKVEACVEKVFELEPESVDGYMLLFRLEMHRRNTDRQVEYLKKVLEHDPQNSDALKWLAFTCVENARMEIAGKILGTIERNDPLDPSLPISKSYMHCASGRFDLALETLEESADTEINDMKKRLLYAMIFIYTDRPENASREVEALERDLPGSYLARLMRLFLDAYEGEKASVEGIMTPDFAAATRQDSQYSTTVAAAYAVLGENDEALDWLENAIDGGFNNYIFFSQHDPFLKRLRKEERFKELMKQAKAKCDRFEALE
jgi:TolB-like protein/thioredoxin-like negative regulator of GroEL